MTSWDTSQEGTILKECIDSIVYIQNVRPLGRWGRGDNEFHNSSPMISNIKYASKTGNYKTIKHYKTKARLTSYDGDYDGGHPRQLSVSGDL